MKLLIASDIHGSAEYCGQLIAAYKRECADKMILLGDILYHGPRNELPDGYAPKKVIEMLNAMKQEILCVRGNCDTEVDQMVLEFPILADYSFMYYDKKMLFFTHGHTLNETKPPMLKSGDVLFNGHTHIPCVREHDDYIYVNPGSVSIPKEGSAHSYIVFADGLIEWKDLSGTVYLKYTV